MLRLNPDRFDTMLTSWDNSNTTNVKVKLSGEYIFTLMRIIQIQPMLRLNGTFQKRCYPQDTIQIQPMLRLNLKFCN